MKSDKEVHVQGSPVTLRPTKPREIGWVISLERDEANAPFVDQWNEKEHLDAIEDPNYAHLVIETDDATRAPLGYAILVGIEDENDSVHFRRIVVGAKGKGVGRRAVRWIKRHVFGELGLHRLWLNVLDNNDRAHSLYLSEGFVQEGVSRDAAKVRNGQYRSYRVMSMLAHEYAGGKDRNGDLSISSD